MTPLGTIALEQVARAARARRREAETVARLEDGRRIVRAKKHERSRRAVFRGRIMTLFKMASEIETMTAAKYLMVIVDKETGDVFLRSSKELKDVLQESSAINDIVAVSRQLRERATLLHAIDPDAKMEPTQFYRACHQQNQRAASNKSVQMPMSLRAAGIKKNKSPKKKNKSAGDVAPPAPDAADGDVGGQKTHQESDAGKTQKEDEDDDDDEKTDDEIQPTELNGVSLLRQTPHVQEEQGGKEKPQKGTQGKPKAQSTVRTRSMTRRGTRRDP